jgi:GT2 family glycosyltransferase
MRDTSDDGAARAAALGNRLLDVEDRTMALRSELARLRRELDAADAATGGAAGFDVPRTRHPWPLAEQPGLHEATLGRYERRVDDAVVIEGRRGALFLARFGLDTPAPDLDGAVAALNAPGRRLRLVPDGAGAPPDVSPDVSIVIPVYGQLGYTLNCLDSLLSHRSRHNAEIIVVDDRSPDRSGEILPQVAGLRIVRQPANVGFIASCNDGAALARGRFVLMLNNDTRVVDGWLDALLDSFATFPEAGLVGSKMCYPDGSLQEAGGIVWRDGSCWNYGRNDDPNRPQYAHARQVDYVSGCSIALPAPLWRGMGGFDPHYAPAYCEDADLCLRVAASGREVWMQPQSRVVHYEGRTSGTDTTRGVKSHQVVNNHRLYLRWRERLETHRRNAEAPYLERERAVRRRILVVDVSAPTPKQDAGSVQTVLALRVCHEAGHKAHFVAEDNWLFQPEHTTALLAGGVECAYAPYDLGFAPYIRRYGAQFDAVLVYRMGMMERVAELVRAHAPQACLLFHVADLHFLRRRREAERDGDEAGLREAEIIRGRELAMVAAADCTITHSPVEAAILHEAAPAAPVVVWPLMVEFAGTAVPFAARRDVCFLGGYRHPPNVDAVRHFAADILPLIRAADPQIRFLVAGANPGPEVLALAGEGIEVVGLVDDLRDLFDAARVFVCPLRVGAGVKGKVMSALSYGVPVVSTPIGVEGAGLEEDRHVVVARSDAEFAQATLALYRDEAEWTRLSLGGQDIVRREFSVAGGRRILADAVRLGHARRRGLDGEAARDAAR